MKEVLRNHGYHMHLAALQLIATFCAIVLLSIFLMPTISYAQDNVATSNTETTQSSDSDSEQKVEAITSDNASAASANQEEENVIVPAIIGVGSILALVYIVTHKLTGKKGNFSKKD